MIRALLFDAAGTLFEPAEPVAETYVRLLGKHGYRLDPTTLDGTFRRAFGDSEPPDYSDCGVGDLAERRWWRQIVERCAGQPVTSEAFKELFSYYATAAAWKVFPDVPPTLRAARDAKLKLAVVSNFDLRLHRILEVLELSPFFDVVHCSADACSRKPDAGIFLGTLKKLDLPASEVVHTGDTFEADVNGAKNAGIRAFHLDRPDRTLADFVAWSKNTQ